MSDSDGGILRYMEGETESIDSDDHYQRAGARISKESLSNVIAQLHARRTFLTLLRVQGSDGMEPKVSVL